MKNSKSFIISKSKNLAELNEDVITLTKISSKDHDNIQNLIIFLHKKLADGSNQVIPVNTYDPNYIYNNKSEINFNFKIVDCSISTLEISNPIDKEFEITYETLQDKLNKLKESETNSRSNISNELIKWKNSVNNLFKDITSWVEPYGNNINHELTEQDIYEEKTGNYLISFLNIRPLFGKSISFIPKGTFIFGAEGRIDINIPNYGKNLMLILNRSNDKDSWFLLIDKDFQKKVEFQKSQFISLLDDAISI